ncbi:MAG: pilus (MSHA type) biogenesis protein MshL [Gammaproteobacteria bacterium]
MRIVLWVPLVLALAACAAPPNGPSTTAQKIDQVLADARDASRPAADPPSAVTDALLPPLSGGRPDIAPHVEPRFDLNVDRQAARSFFMGLVRGTRYNMVVHPEVTGEVSLSLNNVTIPEVMDIARDVYGFEYQENRSGYMVLPAQVRSRVFEVDYLNVKRSGSSRTRVSSGQSTENPQAMMQPGAMGGLGGQAGLANQQQGNRETLSGSSVETESEADFWPLLQSTLEAMVGTGAGRGVIINPQTGTVVVRAMPAELRAIEQYVDMVQSSAQRMVIIDAKVIEVELRDGFESGINWTAIARSGSRTLTGGVLRGRDLFDDGVSPLAGRTIPTSSGNPVPNLDGTGFGGVFGIGIDTTDFDAFIELLQTQGKTQVLSSPRTTAVNNQKAVIKVGNDEYFVTSIGSQTTTGTATNTSSQIQLTPFFSGIALDVTPQISANGEVILHIQPTVSEVSDQTKTFTVSGRTESVPLAFSSVRQSDSIVRARSGQVVVIGGLMRSSARDEAAQAPGLGSIPGIGALFRQNRTRETKSELVILLQPTVVDDSTWHEELDAQHERMRADRP